VKFAYLVLAHKNPQQLALLCKTLSARGGIVFVHVDQKVELAPFQATLSALPGVHLLEQRWPIYWGGFNMVRATLHMCRMALAEGAERLVLLSGLDFPIKPMQEIEHVLGQDADHIDMLTLPCPGLGDGDGFHRIRYFYGMDLMAKLGFKPRALFVAHSRLLPFWHRSPPSGLNIRMGSQWWSLKAQTVRAVLQHVDAHPEVERFFKWTSIPDESFFQTLVNTLAPAKVISNNRRLIVWDRQPKPYVFRANDLDELIKSDALFARKFDEEVDTQILQLLLERQRACTTELSRQP
jgi:Core-2/I-Branching enzyme